MKNKQSESKLSPVAPPVPPFWGVRIIKGILIEEIIPFIDKKILFSGRWRFKSRQTKSGFASSTRYEFESVFNQLLTKIKRQALVSPTVVYGYFPCQSQGNQLLLFQNIGETEPMLFFDFPRQPKQNGLCLADYFQPQSAGVRDVLAVQLVTIGAAAVVEAQRLYQAGEYQNYFYWHGFSAALAEALAEYWHQQIRRELEISRDETPEIPPLFSGHYRGARYSPGYPAFPQLAEQLKIFKLLQPEKIGVELTDEFQMVPEYSTSAIIVHHPLAKYFSVL